MRFSVGELLIILGIVALLFGTRKLRSIGADMGHALKGFRAALRDDEPVDTVVVQEASPSVPDSVVKNSQA